MEIEYASGKCRKKCAQLADIYHMASQKGNTCKNRSAFLYAKIISFLSACNDFNDAMKMPTFKLMRGHMLKGNLQGKWAFDMVHPQRFVFELIGLQRLNDGSFDYSTVKKVRIYDIVDYH